jgi:hypothetical protein
MHPAATPETETLRQTSGAHAPDGPTRQPEGRPAGASPAGAHRRRALAWRGLHQRAQLTEPHRPVLGLGRVAHRNELADTHGGATVLLVGGSSAPATARRVGRRYGFAGGRRSR